VARPLPENTAVDGPCAILLCVSADQQDWQWEAASPLLTSQILTLNEPGRNVVKKMALVDPDPHVYDSTTIFTKQTFETGQHTISFVTSGGDHMFMLGATQVETHDASGLTLDPGHTWAIDTDSGSLLGPGHHLVGDAQRPKAGQIKNGEVLTIQADLDAQAVRFWRDGKPHGPSFDGVTGRLHWMAILPNAGSSVRMVPTPELEPWVAWDGKCDHGGVLL
jgi:hypothetical protein